MEWVFHHHPWRNTKHSRFTDKTKWYVWNVYPFYTTEPSREYSTNKPIRISQQVKIGQLTLADCQQISICSKKVKVGQRLVTKLTWKWVCSTFWSHSCNNASQQGRPPRPNCPGDRWPSLGPPYHWVCYTEGRKEERMDGEKKVEKGRGKQMWNWNKSTINSNLRQMTT